MCTSLPIVPLTRVDLDVRTHRRLETLAKRLLAAEPTLNRVDMFGPNVRCGMAEAPSLFFEDHSEILFCEQETDPLEYRSFLLAGEADFFAIGGGRSHVFEAYCRDELGLGAGTVIEPKSRANTRFMPLSVRCAKDAVLLEQLCQAARKHDRFNVVPYIGTGNAWRLGELIASRSGSEIWVAAPPPRLTKRANDKLWFFERVRDVLQAGSSPLTHSTFGPAALAGRLRSLASRFARVAVKVPDSAGSLGNIIIRSEALVGLSLKQIREKILEILSERGWRGAYPLIVGVWEYPVLASPSVNVWIPRRDEGQPVIQGVFTQALSGDEAAFVGAEPSDLPRPLQERIVLGAACLARYFQNLGYFGPCGFDTILVGNSLEDAAIHWVECNGRWGGVSIPITVANRLIGNWAQKYIIIVQQTNLTMPPRSLATILELLKEHLFSSAKRGGAVLLAPRHLMEGTGLNLMVIANSQSAAHSRLAAVKQILMQ